MIIRELTNDEIIAVAQDLELWGSEFPYGTQSLKPIEFARALFEAARLKEIAQLFGITE